MVVPAVTCCSAPFTNHAPLDVGFDFTKDRAVSTFCSYLRSLKYLITVLDLYCPFLEAETRCSKWDKLHTGN